MAVNTGYKEDEMLNGAYTSFSGADISAVVGNKQLATLQAISYSCTREKGPIYTMRGSADPLAFARGKRAIAGSLVFLMINKQPFIDDIPDDKQQFWGNTSDFKYNVGNEGAVTLDQLFDNGIEEATLDPVQDITSYGKLLTKAWYGDQILPFNVNIVAANEYGQSAKKSVIGIEIMNEGGGISVDDLVLEHQYSYMARSMTPWVDLTKTGAFS